MNKKDKLVIKDAKELVAHIEKIKGDDEAAHTDEDSLRERFIECCANGLYTKKEATEISKVIIKTKMIEFARWGA